MKINFEVLQLLSSRLCHDLIGPVGSLNFSIDLIKEEGSIENKETLNVATTSISNLVNRLNYFRMNFGSASIGEGSMALHKARNLIIKLFAEKNINIMWEENFDNDLERVANNENIKLLLNVFLVIFYAIQKTAEVQVYYKRLKLGIGLAISVKGNNLKLGIDNIQALRLEIKEKDLTPRNVQSYITAIMAENNNSDLQIKDNMQNEIQIAFKLFK